MSGSYAHRRWVAGYTHYVTPVEAALMRRLGWLRDYPWLTAGFKLVSRLGDGVLWGAVAVTLLLVGGTRERAAVGAAAVAAVLAIALFSIMKRVIRRPRPFERWSDLSCLMMPPDRFSFPSGHTLTAFAMYGSLGGAAAGIGASAADLGRVDWSVAGLPRCSLSDRCVGRWPARHLAGAPDCLELVRLAAFLKCHVLIGLPMC